MNFLKKNIGFWQFGDRLFLNAYVPLLFASIVDMHMYMVTHSSNYLLCKKFQTRLIDWILFLNGEDISTKADSYICHCYNTTNNQDIHSEILLQKDIDKYSISKNKNKN